MDSNTTVKHTLAGLKDIRETSIMVLLGGSTEFWVRKKVPNSEGFFNRKAEKTVH